MVWRTGSLCPLLKKKCCPVNLELATEVQETEPPLKLLHFGAKFLTSGKGAEEGPSEEDGPGGVSSWLPLPGLSERIHSQD